jgi:hypothetical protein
MKQCPECAARYDDNVDFCAADGRSLRPVVASPSRLCPHCANSIAEDATQCPYCKAALAEEPTPEWLIRDKHAAEPRPGPRSATFASKVMLLTGIALCVVATGLFALGILGKAESSASRQVLEDKVKELNLKNEQLKATEAELVKARQESEANLKEAETLKARLQESQKGQAAAEVRVKLLQRQLEQRNARPVRVEQRSEPQTPARRPVPARPAGRPADPGLYETTRATEVHEQPAESSRIISRISKGTRINVVRSDGEWLEIVSKRGNPPGFVLRDSAMLVTASN